jgi:hypothetical protein
MDKPEYVDVLPNLFRYHEHFIEKPPKIGDTEKKYRPIVFSEILLNIMEKLLLPEFLHKIEVENEQYLNKPNGVLRAKFKILELMRDHPGKTLVALDLRNAFNMLPHSEI